MTVLQAWNLSSNLLFFQENEFILTLETLPLLIQTCWRLKVGYILITVLNLLLTGS